MSWTCAYDDGRCGLPATVEIKDVQGHVEDRMCRGHAVKVARGAAVRFRYLDTATGRPVVRLLVQVLVEEEI